MLISYIVAYPLSLPLMVCLFWFSRWRWIYLCAHGIDLLGPAGDNPHAIGTGIEKRSETWCHQFLLKSHLELFVIHHTVIIYLFIYFIYDYYFIYLFIFFHSHILYIFFFNCALVYINFLRILCLFAFVIDIFTTTSITLCIYLNNNIFTLGLVFHIKLIFKKLKTNGFVMNG